MRLEEQKGEPQSGILALSGLAPMASGAASEFPGDSHMESGLSKAPSSSFKSHFMVSGGIMLFPNVFI